MSNQPVVPPSCDELDFGARIRFPQVITREYDEIDARRRVAATNGQAPPR
ncbi:MAG: hypothetical protein QOH21_1720, partial [Acidobacteriota bacterium]|nr:hypothetical protein [Acidobacteriota bacterium]